MTTYYLDPLNGNNANAGTSEGAAWQTMTIANTTLVAGDTLRIKATSNITTSIAPVNNGTAGNFITYEAFDETDKPQITDNGGGPSQPIELDNNSYIKIQNIVVDGLGTPPNANFSTWILARTAHHLEFYDCEFYRANGHQGVQCGGTSAAAATRYCKFIRCHFEQCAYLTAGTNLGDMFRFNCAEFNLIEDCTFYRAGHNCIASDYGRYNIIRGCTLDQDWGSSQGTRVLELSNKNTPANWEGGHTLFENNIVKNAFADTAGNIQPSMKIEGIGQIVRFNLVYNGTAFGFLTGQNSSVTSQKGRVYNNVLSTLDGAAWRGTNTSGLASTTEDFKFYNNLFYDILLDPLNDNSGVYDSNFDSYASTYQTTINDLNQWKNNYHKDSGTVYLYFNTRNTLTYWETNYPTLIDDNIVGTNPAIGATGSIADFTYYEPNAGSPLEGAGVPLTTAVGSGSNSTSLTVADSWFFCDGFSIDTGDEICVGSVSNTAVISSINYTTHVITLATPLTWLNGASVSLASMGMSPNIGVFQDVESGGGGGTTGGAFRMASKQETQIVWGGANSVSVTAGSNQTSDAFTFQSDSINGMVMCKADHSTTAGSGDTVDFYILYTLGDPDGASTDEYDTTTQGTYLGTLDTSVTDPALMTKTINVAAKGGKIYAVNNAGEAITVSATLYEIKVT